MSSTLLWIIISGILMSLIALSGSFTLLLPDKLFNKIVTPLVALSAGSLLGGALFHMIPSSIELLGNRLDIYLWLIYGFVTFFFLEQFLNWHHSHHRTDTKKPLTYLILLADALHNFIGGLGVGSAFILDTKLGVTAWLVAAAHEVPQELGDFGILIKGGWKKSKALTFNFLSASTFFMGGLLVYFLSFTTNVDLMVPFAAGNFIYIAASDLIPEIKGGENFKQNIIHFSVFLFGLFLLYFLKIYLK